MPVRFLVWSVTLLLIFSVSIASASSGEALATYRENYRAYREVLEEFKLSREEYLKWGTLAARDQAVINTRLFLNQLAVLLDSYSVLLQEAVREQPSFDPAVQVSSLELLGEHHQFYSSFREKVGPANKLYVFENLSEDLEADYKEGRLDSEFVQLALALAKNAEVRRKTEAFAAEVKEMIEADPTYPERERILEDWLFKITRKLEAAAKAQRRLWEDIAGFGEIDHEYRQRQLLREVEEEAEESRALVLQVVDHLLEILRREKY